MRDRKCDRAPGTSKPVSEILRILASRKSGNLPADMKKVLTALAQIQKAETLKHHNAVRALICLNSTDISISSMGMTWLQGQSIDEADQKVYGFTVAKETPRKIVEALSWVMSLSGPTVLAFDQLDPIVTQFDLRASSQTMPDEKAMAQSIILEIGGGLGAIRDTARNTIVVVSCVENTWQVLRNSVPAPFLARFQPAFALGVVNQSELARAIVRSRLQQAYRRTGFEPPYATWPFREEWFASVRTSTPREILMNCDGHQRDCLSRGEVFEAQKIEQRTRPIGPRRTPDWKSWIFNTVRLIAASDPDVILDENHEDERLAPLLQNALRCLLHELELPRTVDGLVDSEFTGGRTTRPLHARLRLIFHEEKGREEHFCVRGLHAPIPAPIRLG